MPIDVIMITEIIAAMVAYSLISNNTEGTDDDDSFAVAQVDSALHQNETINSGQRCNINRIPPGETPAVGVCVLEKRLGKTKYFMRLLSPLDPEKICFMSDNV